MFGFYYIWKILIQVIYRYIYIIINNKLIILDFQTLPPPFHSDLINIFFLNIYIYTRNNLKELFNKFDKDNNGYLDKTELMGLVKE